MNEFTEHNPNVPLYFVTNTNSEKLTHHPGKCLDFPPGQWDLFFQEEIDEVGAYNVDFHDNDLIPINATLLKPLKRFPQCLADTRAIKSKVSSSRSVNPANSPG